MSTKVIRVLVFCMIIWCDRQRWKSAEDATSPPKDMFRTFPNQIVSFPVETLLTILLMSSALILEIHILSGQAYSFFPKEYNFHVFLFKPSLYGVTALYPGKLTTWEFHGRFPFLLIGCFMPLVDFASDIGTAGKGSIIR